MDFHLIWKAMIIVIGGTILLRFAGRKSIAQMTLAQTVIMIGIGSLLIQPIAGENIWTTLLIGLILVITLIVMELFQVKLDFVENLITGKAKVLIENGKLEEKNLRKVRLTVDQLEMNLRQQNVQKIEDVEWATIEPSGQIAVRLKEDFQPVTKREFKQLKSLLEQTLKQLNVEMDSNIEVTKIKPEQQETIFAEVKRKSHKNKPPSRLD
ncbi:DUF421 domain-containing protein [Oceanobacillus sp. Castelsardo]|uniref:DUF421 domain-containing protein n=1 Tax=Oceanobacillus sp. Castelsardo TaxID=1851204 RepID=UPI000838EA06|nr:DUF421 domain-containing protein [Oceanobacillus sp. Castelsardo]